MSEKCCTVVAVIMIASLIQLANCLDVDNTPPKADCDKYCRKGCSAYFNQPGNEFSRCVDANVYCNCGSNVNNFVLIGVAIVVKVIILGCCCYCCTKCKHGRSGGNYKGSSNVGDVTVTGIGATATAIEMPSPSGTAESFNPAMTPSGVPNRQGRTQLDSEAPPPTYDQVVKQMRRDGNL